MIKNMVKILLGLGMLIAVFIGYAPQPEYLVELTCVSNTLGGLLLLADGIFPFAGRKTCPGVFYRNVAAAISLVFLVCMGSLTGVYNFNFNGAFFFMHAVNPVVFVICYLLFVNERNHKIGAVLTAPVLTLGYILFDYIRYQLTGKFVYGFLDPAALTPVMAIIAGIVICAFLYLLGLGLFALNRLVHANKR